MCKHCDCQTGQECSCGCECGGHAGHFERRYQTKTEQIAELVSYLDELKKEVQAVEEMLADLRK
jgi:predicted phage gp36 major capsid-like protein